MIRTRIRKKANRETPVSQRPDAFFAGQSTEITFDDVTLDTGRTDFLVGDIDITSRITRNVTLKIPLISAAMDTVSGEALAVAIAMRGGIASIPRNPFPDRTKSAEEHAKDQAKIVGSVKHNIHGLITDPVCVHETQTVATVLEMLTKRKFRSVPVVTPDGELLGVLTNQDFISCDDTSMLVRDVMTPFSDLVTGMRGMGMEEAYTFFKSGPARKKNVLPLIDERKKLVGIYLRSDLRRIFEEKSSSNNVDNRGRLRVFAAVGIGEEAFLHASLLAPQDVDGFHIDLAHGWTTTTLETIRYLKRMYPHIDLLAGNVTRGDAALELVEAGADGVVVGMGGGSICTTRRITGVGKPQLSAIHDVAKALRGKNVPVIADGGIRYSGDIVLAIAAGADAAMCGNAFAGTDEAPGDKIPYQGRTVKVYRGMGSKGAQEDSAAARRRYAHGSGVIISEGVKGWVECKGPVSDVVDQLVGGVYKGLFDTGARTIKDLQRNAIFLLNTAAGVRESGPHDLLAFQDAPNYRQPI